MSSGEPLSGFNYLTAKASASRSTVLRVLGTGVLLGLVMAWLWMGPVRSDVADQHARQQDLQAQLNVAEAARRQVSQEVQARQARQAQVDRLRKWQGERQQLLAWMEVLAQSTGPQLKQLRFDGQALLVQGYIAPSQLRGWSVLAAPPGVGSAPQLVEMSAEAGDAAPFDQVRFMLRWPLQADKASP